MILLGDSTKQFLFARYYSKMGMLNSSGLACFIEGGGLFGIEWHPFISNMVVKFLTNEIDTWPLCRHFYARAHDTEAKND